MGNDTVACIKSNVDMYTLTSRSWWGQITVSEDGCLTVISDYGNYGYAWRSFGKSFKKFLITLDGSYLYNKLGRDVPKVFNSKETSQEIRTYIIECRRNKEISSEQAREFWDEVEEIEAMSDTHEYCSFINHWSSSILKLYGEDPSSIPCVEDDNYQLTAFIEKIYPEFVKVLKEELYVASNVSHVMSAG